MHTPPALADISSAIWGVLISGWAVAQCSLLFRSSVVESVLTWATVVLLVGTGYQHAQLREFRICLSVNLRMMYLLFVYQYALYVVLLASLNIDGCRHCANWIKQRRQQSESHQNSFLKFDIYRWSHHESYYQQVQTPSSFPCSAEKSLLSCSKSWTSCTMENGR